MTRLTDISKGYVVCLGFVIAAMFCGHAEANMPGASPQNTSSPIRLPQHHHLVNATPDASHPFRVASTLSLAEEHRRLERDRAERMAEGIQSLPSVVTAHVQVSLPPRTRLLGRRHNTKTRAAALITVRASDVENVPVEVIRRWMAAGLGDIDANEISISVQPAATTESVVTDVVALGPWEVERESLRPLRVTLISLAVLLALQSLLLLALWQRRAAQ